MRNRFGQVLDSNGYAPSLFGNTPVCVNCRRTNGKMDRHEIFHGAYRKKSKALGLWCYLCHDCHMKLHQSKAELDYKLKRDAQSVAQIIYGWGTAEFIQEFGKNYGE